MTDERRFLQFLRRKAGSLLSPGAVAYSRAPGRIDLMGGVADYCGSLVFEGTIAEAAFVAVQPCGDNVLRVRTEGVSSPEILPDCEFRIDELHAAAKRADYPTVRHLFASRPGESWAAYVVGPLFVLWAEKVLRAKPMGLRVLLQSNVPLGSGVASSAAIEVATMRALVGAFNLELDGLEVARLCQKAENLVVGAPCGIMDQVTCALGEAGKLVALRCQPHDVSGLHSLPLGLRVMGVNSGVKHSVGGARYARARVGAFMGLKILSGENGGNNWGGYLTRIAPEEFRLKWCHFLPSRIKGSEFLDRYGEVDDVV
ncbi:MAG: GHMP kinase, partial [Armatimonadetes bacterium]|nr:GHMP kinase [Armatimonadota bacterium]